MDVIASKDLYSVDIGNKIKCKENGTKINYYIYYLTEKVCFKSV